jgi:hypothetical protein
MRALVVVFALAACGGVKNLCTAKNVRCDATLSCDPTDGVCKCGGRGGVICSEGFVCGSGTTCESTKQVDCSATPGTSADVFDGVCKCGGTGGQVCASTDTCNPNSKACVAARNCSLVACGLNETCDAVTGHCVCGASECKAGTTCARADAGTVCVADACTGVTCTGQNRCDPVDGLCKCDGALCLSGERCGCADDAGCARRVCEVGTACAGVICPSPSTCDPVVGQCTCGGPGGPVCGSGQVCSLGPPLRCQGGEQCVTPDGGPTACLSGSSCDPEDGLCKCGGLGGAQCTASQVCIRSAASQACRQPCDVRNPVCAPGTYCYFDSSAATPAAYCSPATDSKAEGAACTQPTACFSSGALHCAGLVLGQTGICRSYCDVSAGNSGCVQVPKAHNCAQNSGLPRALVFACRGRCEQQPCYFGSCYGGRGWSTSCTHGKYREPDPGRPRHR